MQYIHVWYMLSPLSEVPTMRIAGLLLLFFQKVGISQSKWSFIPGMLFKGVFWSRQSEESNQTTAVEDTGWKVTLGEKTMLRWSLGRKLHSVFYSILFIYYLFYEKRCRQPIRMCLTLTAVFFCGWKCLSTAASSVARGAARPTVVSHDFFPRTGPMTLTYAAIPRGAVETPQHCTAASRAIPGSHSCTCTSREDL